jgi:hypothetical protein
VDHNATSPSESFNLTVTQVESSQPPVALATEVYRSLTVGASDPSNAAAVVNSAFALIQIPPTEMQGTLIPQATGTVSGELSSTVLGTVENLSMKSPSGAFCRRRN